MNSADEDSSTRKSPISSRPTSVSQVLQAVSDEPEVWNVPLAEGMTKFKIRVAADHASRMKAYSLAYRIYRRCGYICEDPAELCVSPYDGFAGTITLLAEDQDGRAAGTISLVFDSPFGLPCHEIYKPEADVLREQGRRLVEIIRLALEDDIPDARVLLMYLFSMAYIFAHRVGNCTDLLVEVNPRHVAFYRRMLRFHIAGGEKPCPRVKGAPAVLLRMDCADMDAAQAARSDPRRGHNEAGRRGAGSDAEQKRLHPYPFTPADERRAATFMSRQHRPMTFDELARFKIAGLAAPVDALAAV